LSKHHGLHTRRAGRLPANSATPPAAPLQCSRFALISIDALKRLDLLYSTAALVRGTMQKSAKSTARKNGSGEVIIPDKLYFRIGEVSRLCRLPSYVLRFWETEFPQLKPPKSSTGQRTYRRADVENVLRIKRLLYEEGFTIAGARAQLRAEARRKQAPLPFAAPSADVAELKQLRQGLREVLGILAARRQTAPRGQ